MCGAMSGVQAEDAGCADIAACSKLLATRACDSELLLPPGGASRRLASAAIAGVALLL